MRLYNKFCRSPGHRVPKIVEKIDRGPFMVQCAMHNSASKLYSVQELVSSADDSSQLCAANFQ